MNIVLHIPQPDTTVVEKRITDLKKEYCKIHGYEYVEKELLNTTAHWNERYWSHFAIILDIIETRSDVEWVFYVLSPTIINDTHRPVFELTEQFPNKNLIFGAIDFKMDKWLILTEKEVAVTSNLEPHLHRSILSTCLFVKNCDESKKWLSKLYTDNRFNEGIHNEENGKKYDPFKGDGHQVVDQALTLYFETYPEFRDMVQLIPFGSECNLGTILRPEEDNIKANRAFCSWAKLLNDTNTETLINPELHKEHTQKSFLKFITCNMNPEELFK